jgi:ribonuclease Z
MNEKDPKVEQSSTAKTSRRSFLKGGAAAAGAAMLGAAGVTVLDGREAAAQSGGPKSGASETFKMKTIIAQPDIFYYPGEELAQDEIRVSIMGSGWGNIVRRTQAACSIFIELGNGDSFVWDMGQGSFVNYNTMQVPLSSMDKVFLTHLHMDHTTDLLPLYCFGPSSGDRFTPLKIYGPSGDKPELGVKYMMEKGMKAYTNWHVTSFRTAVPGTSPTDGGYGLEVTELDYRKSGGIAYKKNGVTIKHWPALHVIDGAIGYRLDWNGMSVCWSGDTNPSHFFVDNCQGVDLMMHETAPTLDRLSLANAIPKKIAEMIITAAHTPARALGKIFSLTKPQLGVTVHSPVDEQEVTTYVDDVRVHWKGPYQIAQDFMVFNISKSKDTITVRRAAINDRAWSPNIMKVASHKPTLKAADYRKSGFWKKEIKDY